jgi:hypothetical protein
MYFLNGLFAFLYVIALLAALILPWAIAAALDSKKVLAFMGSAIILWSLAAGFALAKYAVMNSTRQTETFTVNKSERVQYDKSSKYLIFTDTGVYENTDSLFNLKFNSSDLYNQIKAGKTYTCQTWGWRVEIFSSYRNILSCTEVERR